MTDQDLRRGIVVETPADMLKSEPWPLHRVRVLDADGRQTLATYLVASISPGEAITAAKAHHRTFRPMLAVMSGRWTVGSVPRDLRDALLAAAHDLTD